MPYKDPMVAAEKGREYAREAVGYLENPMRLAVEKYIKDWE
jgi:hypothetical protein